MRLKDKVAIVTGAASGFGEGMAKRFAEEGAKVVVADLNAKGAERVAKEIGEAAIHVATDVSVRSEIDEMVYAAKSAFGRIDIMVNNAGYTHRNGDMLAVAEDVFDLITAVNMKAIYYAALAVVPIMERQGGGVILTTASTAGLRPRPGPDLVQRLEGMGDHRDQIDGGRARSEEHPRQLPLPGRRRNRHAGEIHGRGHAADARQIPRFDPAWPPVDAARHRQCRALARLGRSGVHHRRRAGGRWRKVYLKGATPPAHGADDLAEQRVQVVAMAASGGRIVFP